MNIPVSRISKEMLLDYYFDLQGIRKIKQQFELAKSCTFISTELFSIENLFLCPHTVKQTNTN